MKYENQNKLKEVIDAIIKSENEELVLSYEKNQNYNIELHKENKKLCDQIKSQDKKINDMFYIIKEYEIITGKYFDVDYIEDGNPETGESWIADVVVREITKEQKYPKIKEVIEQEESPF